MVRLPKLECRGLRCLPPTAWLALIGVSVALAAAGTMLGICYGAVPICVLTKAAAWLADHGKV